MSEEWDELPEGWEVKPLGEICDITGGGTPRREEEKYFGGPVPWATPTDIHPEQILLISKTKTTITEIGLRESSARLFKPGTVLFSSRASIGKIAIADVPMATNQGFANLTPRNGLDSKFLAYGLKFLTDEIKKLGSGTTFIEVPKSALREFEFPLPSLPEQRRIVQKIERLLSESRTAREALDRVSALLKRFRQAVLAKAFRGELTERDPIDEPAAVLLERIQEERRRKWEEGKGAKSKKYVEPDLPDTSDLQELPEGWVWATVNQLASIATGATPLRSKKTYYIGGTIPWVTSGSLNAPIVREADEFITELALRETNVKIFPKGTLLVAMYGEGQTRGRVSELGIKATTNQACAALRFDGLTERCRQWVKLFFQKNYEDIRLLSSGGVQPNLNLSMIRNTSLPLPPLGEQSRLVAKIESLFTQVEAIERAVEMARRRAEKVDGAVLARAFRGEL